MNEIDLLLEEIEELVGNSSKEEIEDVGNLRDELEKSINLRSLDELSELKKLLEDIKFALSNKKELDLRPLINEIKSNNKFKLENIEDLPKPKDEISVKRPKWLDELKYQELGSILQFLAKLNKSGIDVRVLNLDANRPIAVRLSDGQNFYKAVFQAAMTGGALSSFKDVNDYNQRALVDSSGHPQVDVLTMPQVTVDLKETTDFEGGPVTVGTSAVEITFAGVTQSISIQADHDNTGTIYIGKANVTSAGANAMKRLEPGESVELDLNDAAAPIYVVASVVAQKVYKLALL